MTHTIHSICLRPLAVAAAFAISSLLSAAVWGQAAFPVGFAVDTYGLERVPTELKFQARISQARMPVGDGQFSQLMAKLIRDGTTEVCTQTFTNVSVQDSVLNLDINDLSCTDRNGLAIAVDEAIAQFANLELQVCVGEGNCLASVPLGSVPYAIKSSFAVQAHEARMAEVSGQAHYAHRATADLDMLTSGQLGTGYFDFVTPDGGYVPGALDIYTDYSPHFDEGFVSWVPVSAAPDARRLNVCAQDDLGNLVDLDGFVVHAATTFVGGALWVESSSTLHGPVVAESGISVHSGSLSVDTGIVHVLQGQVVVAGGKVRIHSEGIDAPFGRVTADTVKASNILHSTGNLYVGGVPANPSPTGEMVVNTPASFSGNVSVGNDAALGQVSIHGDLLVGSGAVGANPTAQEMVVTASSTFSGPASFTDLGAGVSFSGPASFEDSVSFADTSTVTFHGPVSFEQPISLLAGIGIPNGSVTNASIVDGAVDSRTIADDTILAADLHPSVRGILQNSAWESWTAGAFFPTESIYDIAYGNGLWVAVGPKGGIYTSTTGDTWQAASSGTLNTFHGVTYSPTAGWMAVGWGYPPDAVDDADIHCIFSMSADGIWWTTTYGNPGYCNVAEHDGVGLWVAPGEYGYIHTSPDGITWGGVANAAITPILNGVAYGDGTWVVVGRNRDGNAAIAASADGTTWSSQLDTEVSGTFTDVAYDGAGQFVAVGSAGLFTSSNGTSWTRVMPGNFAKVAYGGGSWIVSAGGSDLISSDGITWRTVNIFPVTLASDGSGTWLGVYNADTIFRHTSISGL